MWKRNFGTSTPLHTRIPRNCAKLNFELCETCPYRRRGDGQVAFACPFCKERATKWFTIARTLDEDGIDVALDETLCQGCTANLATYFVDPCGHLCFCEDCLSNATRAICQVCETAINDVVKIIFLWTYKHHFCIVLFFASNFIFMLHLQKIVTFSYRQRGTIFFSLTEIDTKLECFCHVRLLMYRERQRCL